MAEGIRCEKNRQASKSEIWSIAFYFWDVYNSVIDF